MKSSGLLKWLMIPIALLVLWVMIRVFSGGDGGAATGDRTPRLTPEEMRALGIEGDSPHDTVATLIGQVKQLRTELQGAVADNKVHKTENERLRQRDNQIEQRIRNAVDGEQRKLKAEQQRLEQERRQSQELLQQVQRQMETLSQAADATELPVGLGLRDDEMLAAERDTLQWVEPGDAPSADGRQAATAMGFPNRFGPAQQPLNTGEADISAPASFGTTASAATPVYTLPANATLMGSISMTALIGRVPIDGTVNDPYPFKVLIGPDNLTANGIDLPGVAGAVVSGTATGDWTLSCVRGQIRSLTFVFQDGTIRTVPEDGQRQRQGQASGQDGLGWISDPYGIPCVGGERRSNAQQYLGTQALITAAGAGAAALIPSEGGNVSYINNRDGSMGSVGISGNEAMGRVLAGGVQDMSQWVNRLYGQAFAAVYVEPGAQVAIHLEQAVAIDYAPDGRRVNHEIGGHDAMELD